MCHLTNNKLNKKMNPIGFNDLKECLLDTYRKLLNKKEIIKREYSKFHDNCDFIEIHYTLINNENDSDEELNLLYELLELLLSDNVYDKLKYY